MEKEQMAYKKKDKENIEKKENKDIQKFKEEAIKNMELAENYLDQLQRLKAEFENYRKRMLRESEVKFKTGEKTLAKGLLYVLDNLQRALDSEQIDREGIELIYKEFCNILRARGLQKMEADGEIFDPNFHHALNFVSVSGGTNGEIVEVIQPGYFWDTEVLRPAQVIVAKVDEEEDNDIDKEKGGK